MGRPIKDLTGKTFNSLTVIRKADHRVGIMNRTAWVCRCVCGSEVVVIGPNLENGGTKSCGCRKRERCANTLIDLTGQVFGNRTVIERDISKTEGESHWIARCACGTVSSVSSTHLRNGTCISCGCLRRELTLDTLSPDLTGNRYGTLTVINRGVFKEGMCWWVVRCDCGVIKEVPSNRLKRSKSCGCKTKEILSAAHTIHGMHGTPEYRRAQSHKHRELSRLHDSEWTLEMGMFIEELFPVCVVCQMTNQESLDRWGKSLTLDHVIPISKGGGLKPGNVVVLCQHCNSVKNDRDLNSLPQNMREKILAAAEDFRVAWETYKESL